jgi:DNA-binding beta-propeller fold protein YncE
MMQYALLACLSASSVLLVSCATLRGDDKPAFRVDPAWPKPFAEDRGVQLVVGQVAGIAVNPNNGHVWIVHRPATLLPDEWDPKANRPITHRCCKSMAAVVEFDRAGNYVRGWGGPGAGYDWPKTEHGIHVDEENNVWLAGNGNEDHQILKFSPEGKFLMQIGRPGKSEGSNSRAQLGRPAHMVLDAKAKELFVADGYGNRRIVVFDAASGAYKRHWGAYGETPSDDKLPSYDPAQPLPRQFGNPVHCVRLSNDGLVYVCDRVNNRIQVFDRQGRFQREFRVEVQTLANGAVWDMVLSQDPAQRHLYVADGANGRIYALRRSDGAPLGSFGRTGRMAGEFKWIHNIAIDPQGNLFTSEVGFGRRIQKFERVN